MSAKSRNNYRAAVGTLFYFAEARGYVVKGTVDIESIAVAREKGTDIEIFRPEEMERILAVVEQKPDFVPFMAIGAFAGLRTTVAGLHEAIDYLSAQGKFEDKRIHPPPDLLLLDYHLRIHSALDLLRWLEQDNSRLPVIIFGGAQGTGSVPPCFEAGADAWIEKPKHASVWNDITAALQLCLASVPPDLGPLGSISILSGRRLRAELRANVDEHKRLVQQRGQLTRLLDGTIAEQKEAKKKIPFQRRSRDAG